MGLQCSNQYLMNDRNNCRRGFRGGAAQAAAPPFAGIFVRDL